MTGLETLPPRAIVRPHGWGTHYRHVAALEEATRRIAGLSYDRYDRQRRRYVLRIDGWDHELALSGAEVDTFLAAFELGRTGTMDDSRHRELAA